MAEEANKKTTMPESKSQNLAPREYTDEEKARIAKYDQRVKNKSLKVKKRPGGRVIEMQDAPDSLNCAKLFEATGTADGDLQAYLLEQVAAVFKGATEENSEKLVPIVNQALALLNGIQPMDEIEGMLAVQMIGVHNMAMVTLGRGIMKDQTFEGKEADVNQATKMLRTFIAQMEALKKYRTGGQQKMTVEHVHVNEGGQAIVGTVNQGGGGKNNENCG